MKVIILAAGYAVRLHPLTLDTPKPLLKIGSKTLIDRIFDKLDSVKGWDRAYVVTNAKFSGNFRQWLKSSARAGKVEIIDDGSTANENRLGAIKDMELVITGRSIDDDVLIAAGDNLFDFDLARFTDFAGSHADGVSVALYDVKDRELAKSYGIVALDASGRVVDFEEKPKEPKSTLASTGIYYFPKNKLSFISKYVKMQDKLDPSAGSGSTPSGAIVRDQRSRGVDAPGYYIGWLSVTDKVYGYRFLEDWFDIGTIESYRKADRQYTEKER